MRRNKKGLLGKFAVIALALGAILGVAHLISKNDEDLRTQRVTFNVGGLNENGKYAESENSLYTKKSFDCKGLKIELDFDADIEYQVFFYDENDNFVESSERLSSGQTFEDVEDHVKARIVIYPNWNDVKVEDQKINIFNKVTYTSQMKILVAKEQVVDEVPTTTQA